MSHQKSTGHWFELYSTQLNLSVVVVAGTDIGKVNDILEEVKMWIEPVRVCVFTCVCVRVCACACAYVLCLCAYSVVIPVPRRLSHRSC